MSAITISSRIHDYQANICYDFDFLNSLKALPNRTFVIDKIVYEMYPNHFADIDKNDMFLIDAKESIKNLSTVESLLLFLSEKPGKRGMNLVSFGGGIVQDVSGFAASILYRGVNWHFVPTTFLAQADSCVGSKTSLNFHGFKNILGGFYPPHQVYICPLFLDTLADEDIYSGIGEVVKFLLLDDTGPIDIDYIENLAKSLTRRERLEEAIEKSLRVKQSYIKQDEFDLGKRNLFNYGHCFGHGLESASEYAIPHGIAVTIGMIFSNILALYRGAISKEVYERLNNLMLPLIPIELHLEHFDYERILSAMKNDKKRTGEGLVVVMLASDSFAAVKATDVTTVEFDYCFKALLRTLQIS